MPTMELVPPRDWPTLGPTAIEWMEHYLCHGPGDVQGEPLVLNDEAAQFVYDCYRLYPKGHPRAGRRVVTFAGLSEPKGFAKSELAGALACFELRGPCRFREWHRGDPVGKQITYPFIRALATEETQAGTHTFLNSYSMLEYAREKFGRDEWRFDLLDIGATRIFVGKNGTDGELRPSTSGSASKDGGKETFVVEDEPHLYYVPELRTMHETVRRNSVKRRTAQPWMLATTTMFEAGQQSVAEDLYNEADRLLETKRKTFGFLWHHREGFEVPKDQRHDDDVVLASLREAYEPVLDYMDPEYILENDIRAPGAVWEKAVRYFINRRGSGAGKAVDPDQWDRLADPSRTPGPGSGRRILMAFDGSDGGSAPYPDDTVLIGWTIEKRPHLFVIGRWHKPDDLRGPWKVPRRDVRAKVTTTRLGLKVVRFVCDPPGWRDEIDNAETGWVAEFGEAKFGKKTEPICIEFDTKQSTKMDPAIDRILEAIDEEAFTHDGSPELTAYALHAVLGKVSGRSQRKILVKPSQTEKIDGFVAATFGYDELQHLAVVSAPDPIVGDSTPKDTGGDFFRPSGRLRI